MLKLKLILFFIIFFTPCLYAEISPIVSDLIKANPDKTGAYILDKGQDSLVARAWLTNNAKKSINIQYFIWSTDTVGILASEALLSAAKRGVKAKVIVDDFLLKADSKSLLALDTHPNIDIKIYNPVVRTGVAAIKKYYNLLLNFKKFNQRMHDKTFIVDGQVGITGGRNMADEYFDYDDKYTFRDRDILLIGNIVSSMNKSFDLFWNSDLTISVSNLYGKRLDRNEIEKIYKDLHLFANNLDNYPKEIKEVIINLDKHFIQIAKDFKFVDAKWLFDLPGKNRNSDLGGSGHSTKSLVKVLENAKKSILIQSPYLVFDEPTLIFFEELLKKGVEIKISTNSLESTDNLLAFSGYHKHRERLIRLGIKIYEFKATPKVLETLMQRYDNLKQKPIFAIHSKSFVVDNEISYIGTFNFDPRSINLNTEVGVLIIDKNLAKNLSRAINNDILPENSYDLSKTNPDRRVSWLKRFKLWFFKLLPLQSIL